MENLSLEDVDVNMIKMLDINSLISDMLEDLSEYQLEVNTATNLNDKKLVETKMMHELSINLSKIKTLNSILNDYINSNQHLMQELIKTQYKD